MVHLYVCLVDDGNETDTGLDHVDCPAGLLVPNYDSMGGITTTTPEPRTGAPGATGSSGPRVRDTSQDTSFL